MSKTTDRKSDYPPGFSTFYTIPCTVPVGHWPTGTSSLEGH